MEKQDLAQLLLYLIFGKNLMVFRVKDVKFRYDFPVQRVKKAFDAHARVRCNLF